MKKLPLLLVLFLLMLLAWHSARAGYASLLTSKVDSVSDLPAVTTAARLSPGDPRAQVLLGALLEANDDRAAALPHYQTAVALRPDDYLLRLQLARGQELSGDTQAAISSATVAVTLAPFYAQPHWQLGNILVRAGRHDDGFSELRLAAASNPTLFPAVIDLAWQLSGGSVDYVLAAIQPHTPDAYRALANYFKKHDEVNAAIDMLEAGGAATAVERRAYIAELIAAGRFAAARRLWGHWEHPVDPDEGARLFDAGFEDEIDLDEPGFSWRVNNADPAVTLSLDNGNPKEGRASLRVNFNGAANAGAAVLSQLVLVAPSTSYRLYFAVRTENLVSGGLPNVSIVDASDNKPLGQTGALPQTTSGWQDTTINFTTGAATTAIRISLGRQPCPASQCPIFGKLWLDDFRLTPAPNVQSPRSKVNDQPATRANE